MNFRKILPGSQKQYLFKQKVFLRCVGFFFGGHTNCFYMSVTSPFVSAAARTLHPTNTRVHSYLHHFTA